MAENFGTLYTSLLLPLNERYSIIKNAVMECAYAGCDTIWIVVDENLLWSIKKEIGEWVYDPVVDDRKLFTLYKGIGMPEKTIPILYTTIHPKDRDRRSSYGWSVLHGINASWRASHYISKWIEPQAYYVCFPHGVFDTRAVRKARLAIRHKKAYFSYNKKTIKDGLLTSFIMTPEDFSTCRKWINRNTTRTYYPPDEEKGEIYPTKKRPIHERWSAKNFTLEQVFSEMDFTNRVQIDLEWFYDTSTFKGYSEAISNCDKIYIPHEKYHKTHLINKMGLFHNTSLYNPE